VEKTVKTALIIFVIYILIAFALIYSGKIGMIESVISFFLNLANTAFALYFYEKGKNRKNQIFLFYVLGGMGLRLLGIALAFIILVLFLNIDIYKFIFMFFFLYFCLLAAEILHYKTNVSKI